MGVQSIFAILRPFFREKQLKKEGKINEMGERTKFSFSHPRNCPKRGRENQKYALSPIPPFSRRNITESGGCCGHGSQSLPFYAHFHTVPANHFLVTNALPAAKPCVPPRTKECPGRSEAVPKPDCSESKPNQSLSKLRKKPNSKLPQKAK